MKEKALSLAKIRALEAKAKALGLNERLLIENASSNLAAALCSLPVGKKILALAGGGNNGADVLACARKLSARGYHVTAALLGEKELRGEVLFQKEILETINIPLYRITNNNLTAFVSLLRKSECILDGILGVGIHGEVSHFLKQVITLINQSGKTIISCDIPSGLFPDDGAIAGAAVRADYTITFIAAKRGFFMRAGARLCGKIIVVDIGISRQILERL